MHAETAEAVGWWARPRGAQTDDWIGHYRNSLRQPQREAIVGALRGIPGVTSVLEVGCHCGPNLIRLAQDIPTLEQLTGIDVNVDAVKAGRSWVQTLGLHDRIDIVQGRIPDKTAALASGCVDVVVSCYALAYIAPPDLDAVLYELGRLAAKALVLAEPMPGGGERPAQWSGYREWAHDYAAAAKWLGTWRGCALTIVPVGPPVERLRSMLVATRS